MLGDLGGDVKPQGALPNSLTSVINLRERLRLRE